MRYLIVDTANTFFRAKHAAHRHSDAEEKLGFALHATLGSVGKAWREQKTDHVVWCLEGHSWRKGMYKPYKANRVVTKAKMTVKQQEEDALFFEVYNLLIEYIRDCTNCTVLQNSTLEADDLIAGWTQQHPTDHHTIVSSDSDFLQLISENVAQYNGVAGQLITTAGYFDHKGKPILDKKTKLPKTVNPQWALFEKCVRGDTSDNIFSAYPGVRTKGSSKKAGLQEAFADRHSRGVDWNNMMLQRFQHHDGTEHRVLDDYTRNCTLVDLTKQPDAIKETIKQTIITGAVQKSVPMVGARFLKFCGKHQLIALSDRANVFAKIFVAPYPSSV